MYQNTGVLGAGTTATGIAILPNTGDNLLLLVLGITTLVVGSVILGSFVFTRVAQFVNHK